MDKHENIMTQDEYKAEFRRIFAETTALDKLGKELKAAYIEEFCPFNGGDKVKITTADYFQPEKIKEELIGIVADCRVGFDGELNYTFRKVKKDGTPSNHNLYIYGKIKSVELITPATNTEL